MKKSDELVTDMITLCLKIEHRLDRIKSCDIARIHKEILEDVRNMQDVLIDHQKGIQKSIAIIDKGIKSSNKDVAAAWNHIKDSMFYTD